MGFNDLNIVLQYKSVSAAAAVAADGFRAGGWT
jgi:hypothetical protein